MTPGLPSRIIQRGLLSNIFPTPEQEMALARAPKKGYRGLLNEAPSRSDGILSDYWLRQAMRTAPQIAGGEGQDTIMGGDMDPQWERGIMEGEFEEPAYGGLLDPAARRMQMVGTTLSSLGMGLLSSPNIGTGLAQGTALASQNLARDRDRYRDDLLLQMKIAEMGRPEGRTQQLSEQQEIDIFGKNMPGYYQQAPDGSISQISGSAVDDKPNDAWKMLDAATVASLGFRPGTVVSQNSRTGAYEVEQGPLDPGGGRQETDLERKVGFLRTLYPNGGSEYDAHLLNIIGAGGGDTSQSEAQIAALMQRGYSRKDAEDVAFGFVKTITNPTTGDSMLVNLTTGEARPLQMPDGLPKTVATDLAGQNVTLESVIGEIDALKNNVNGYGLGVGGVVLDAWNRTGGQLVPGSVSGENIDQRTAIAALRERIIQAISGDPRFSNQDRARIEQMLPSMSVMESPERARRQLDAVQQILDARRQSNAQQLGGGYTPPPGAADPLAGAPLLGGPTMAPSGDPFAGAPQLPGATGGAPAGSIADMPVENLLTLDPSQLSAADQKALDARLRALGY